MIVRMFQCALKATTPPLVSPLFLSDVRDVRVQEGDGGRVDGAVSDVTVSATLIKGHTRLS